MKSAISVINALYENFINFATSSTLILDGFKYTPWSAMANFLPQHSTCESLLDLLLLQLDSLVVDKHPLALVRLRRPPLPHPPRKRHDDLAIRTLQQDSRRRGRRHRNALRNALLDRVREAQLQTEELLARVLLLGAAALDARSVAHAHQAQDGRVALGHPHYIVGQVGPRRACVDQLLAKLYRTCPRDGVCKILTGRGHDVPHISF